MSPDPPSRVSVFPILSVTFVGTLGFSIVLPFLVFLVTRLGGNALVYGIMGATYSAFQLVGAPILGRWSDRFGRKRVLLLSQLGTLTSWAIFLVALTLPTTVLGTVDSPWLGSFTVTVPLVILFVARALDGITGGNVSVANAYMADITPDADRVANFGRMAVASNLGFIVGPMIAGLLGAAGWGEIPPVGAALIISIIASLLIAFRLHEPARCTLTRDPEQTNVRKVLGQEHKECFELEGAPPLSIPAILRLPGIGVLLIIYFLVFLAFNLFYVAFPVYAVETLSWTLTDTGIFFAVLGLLLAVVQGPVLQRLSGTLPDRTLVLGGSVLLGASFLFFTSQVTSVVYGGTVFLALGNGLMWPSLLALLSRSAGDRVQGAVQGFAGTAGAVASIVGLVVGGVLFTALESRVFLLSAAIIAAATLIGLTVRSPRRAS